MTAVVQSFRYYLDLFDLVYVIIKVLYAVPAQSGTLQASLASDESLHNEDPEG